MFERLDFESLKAVIFATQQGVANQSRTVGTELILLGLIIQGNSNGDENCPDIRTVSPLCTVLNFLRGKEISLERIQAAIYDVLEPDIEDEFTSPFVTPSPSTQVVELGANYTSVLFAFTEERSFSERAIQVVKRAEAKANRYQQRFINVIHLLLGIIEEGQELVEGQPSNAVRILESLGINLQELQEYLRQAIEEQN